MRKQLGSGGAAQDERPQGMAGEDVGGTATRPDAQLGVSLQPAEACGLAGVPREGAPILVLQRMLDNAGREIGPPEFKLIGGKPSDGAVEMAGFGFAEVVALDSRMQASISVVDTHGEILGIVRSADGPLL